MGRKKVANLNTIILWAVIGAMLTSVIAIGKVQAWFIAPSDQIPDLVLPAIELALLAISGGLSTSYCYIIHYNLRDAFGAKDEELNFILLCGILSIIFFGAAVYLTEQIEPFLMVVILIYGNFCLINYLHLQFLLNKARVSNDRAGARRQFHSLIETMTWLREENGIAVLALTVIAIMVFALTVAHACLGDGAGVEVSAAMNEFHRQMKAFIVGAAILHVVISIIKYFYKYSKDDVLDQTIAELSDNVDNALDGLEHDSSVREKFAIQIWTLSINEKGSFLRSRNRWKWLIIGALFLSAILCISSYILNRHYEPGLRIPTITF